MYSERRYHKPRFPQEVKLSDVPPGMELHKFYGQPILLPEPEEGEAILKCGYTRRQLDRLILLQRERNRKAGTQNFLTNTFGDKLQSLSSVVFADFRIEREDGKMTP